MVTVHYQLQELNIVLGSPTKKFLKATNLSKNFARNPENFCQKDDLKEKNLQLDKNGTKPPSQKIFCNIGKIDGQKLISKQYINLNNVSIFSFYRSLKKDLQKGSLLASGIIEWSYCKFIPLKKFACLCLIEISLPYLPDY